MPTIAILGSTGSIGRMTLEVISSLGPDFRVVALAAGRQVDLLARQAAESGAVSVAVCDDEAARGLRRALPEGAAPEVLVGPEGLVALASRDDVDIVVSAVGGGAGLPAALAAARAGKRLALANKEALVMAGHLVMAEAKASGAQVIPVDSEHSAIFQAMASGRAGEVRRVVLTASGGPFYRRPDEARESVTAAEALDHPTWSMGRKITIDSATLMNKTLEVIEAHHLFGLEAEKIQVLIHPESTVHSLVEFVDGSVIAQLGPPDMRMPIQYALTYPERRPAPWPRLDLAALGQLHFEVPDTDRFPALALGFEVVREGGTLGAVLSGADEVAVGAFLDGRIRFVDIVPLVERVLVAHRRRSAGAPRADKPNLENILAADAWAREELARCLTSYTVSR
ncbi:MAG TPA: 1-deoxy-D-xylulose-5-phosphate reductoisomerase [Phycisphaerae bacterium]|nr:1-deoxy-D-xylulose-5-phosphate reductoisomerase [Phycisphaerae bacterium]